MYFLVISWRKNILNTIFISTISKWKKNDIPWRVLPGRLSVSRTFGDLEAKEEKFGGMKNVIVALPDITEIELNNEYNLIIMGCDVFYLMKNY